jgi:hypothetical protein
MPPRRSLPPDAELAVKGHVEPVLINGGQTIKSLSALFLADLERHWRVHGPKVLDVLAEKYPQAYFGGMVALSKVIRWEVGEAGAFDRSLTPDEIMDRLEKRVGPEGRKLFERFLRQVNQLQAQQQLEAQAQTGDNGGR